MSSNIVSFYKAWLKNPRSIGAVFPSSKQLSRTIASFVPLDDDKLVLELGPGTGVITKALLKRGVDPKRIVAIEASKPLARDLKIRFPGITVIHGDAAFAQSLLKRLQRKHQVGSVVSSLPLLSFPQETTEAILQQTTETLVTGGRYIQYTYRCKDTWPDAFIHYKKIATKLIWINIPPARIYVYTKDSTSIAEQSLVLKKPKKDR